MSKQAIERMIQEHAEAIRRNEYPITHGTICDVLVDLAEEKLTTEQAITILEQTARTVDQVPVRWALYHQAIEALQAMQAAEA